MSNSSLSWREVISRILDYFLRKTYLSYKLLGAGVAIIIASIGVGSLVGKFSWVGADSSLQLSFSTDGGGISVGLLQVAFFLGVSLVVLGVALGVVDYCKQHAFDSRQRLVVIEQRGLHQGVDVPLKDNLPLKASGHVVPLKIDHRQLAQTGTIASPEDALSVMQNLRGSLQEQRTEYGPDNIRVVYGGIAPVPFTFLAGMLVDDENVVTVTDWDRTQSRWRLLNDDDDDERFLISGFDGLEEGETEVAITIAVSYPTDVSGVGQVIGKTPIIKLELPNLSTSRHWSVVKQAALAEQFASLMRQLLARGIQRVHLFIAAPNSVVFTLGRSYDDRLFPDALVYQYERSNTPAFPWAVKLPTHGVNAASIMHLEAQT